MWWFCRTTDPGPTSSGWAQVLRTLVWPLALAGLWLCAVLWWVVNALLFSLSLVIFGPVLPLLIHAAGACVATVGVALNAQVRRASVALRWIIAITMLGMTASWPYYALTRAPAPPPTAESLIVGCRDPLFAACGESLDPLTGIGLLLVAGHGILGTLFFAARLLMARPGLSTRMSRDASNA